MLTLISWHSWSTLLKRTGCRLPASAYDDLLRAVNNPAHVFMEAALTAEVVESMRQVPRSDVPDMPDPAPFRSQISNQWDTALIYGQ